MAPIARHDRQAGPRREVLYRVANVDCKPHFDGILREQLLPEQIESASMIVADNGIDGGARVFDHPELLVLQNKMLMC